MSPFERETRITEFLLGTLNRVVPEIDSATMLDRPTEAHNPPAWILGHLAVIADRGLMVLGRTRCTPESWDALFLPGTQPPKRDAAVPPRDELLDAVNRGYAALIAAAREADIAALDKPHGVGLLANSPIRTAADLISHMLTSHFSLHVGQLSYWRRWAGFAPLF